MLYLTNHLKAVLVKFSLLVSLLMFYSCTVKTPDYIATYNKANEIDSILRFRNDTLLVIKKYRKLFRKYPPFNRERTAEYNTFIMLADRHHKRIGGKKSLFKLIPLLAPYGEAYRPYLPLYFKYGIDSVSVKLKIADWKKNRNKKLVDSFTVAFIRDQEGKRSDIHIMRRNDKKNALLLKWTLENYGFPSVDKIGVVGNDQTFMPMDNLLGHMIESEYYPFFKEEIFKAVKAGACPPRTYAVMVDKYNLLIAKEPILYGAYMGYDTVLDTAKIDKNRKAIGMPSLKHSHLISRNYFKKK